MSEPISTVSVFAVNERFLLTVKFVGHENNCVLILDDFFKFPDLVRDYIIGQGQFSKPRYKYPGIQSPLPPDYIAVAIDALKAPVLEHFKSKIKLGSQNRGSFSLVTLKPEELCLLQTVPHFDTVDPYQLATVHYLSLPQMCWGGTGLYRHRATGFESISEARLKIYDFSQFKHRHQYITESNQDFELVELIPMKYNRLIVYQSNLLHSGYINPSMLSKDPQKGRLTGNLFIQGKAAYFNPWISSVQ